jgi:3-isopropylmalate/(R)-2-methylmalate dehydratase small subunit
MADIELTRTGRVWKFGDEINTDLIMPQTAFRLPEEQQPPYVFSAIRPGWSELVNPGDIIIGGKNFGLGSSRPIGAVLRVCGIDGLVADSVNGLCLRTLVNFKLPAISCPGVSEAFEEGDIARIDYLSGVVENLTRHRTLQGIPLPKLLGEIVIAGGIMPMLIAEGYVDAERSKSVA